MITEVLTNLAYLYYPKNICPWNQKELYLESVEYKRLEKVIDLFNSNENQKIRSTIMAEFDKDLVLRIFRIFQGWICKIDVIHFF